MGILEVFLLIMGGTAASTVGGAVFVRSRIRRRLRVIPTTKSAVPTYWILSPAGVARMHRDLRSVGLVLTTTTAHLQGSVASDHPLLDVGQHLQARAVEIDRDIALLRKLSGPSKKSRFERVKEQLHEFRAAVEVYESTASAVTRSLRSDRTSGSADAIRDLNERMTALKQAINELDDVPMRPGAASTPGQSTAVTQQSEGTRLE